MRAKRFDRHNLFDRELVGYHSETINLVQRWCMDNNVSIFGGVPNMLSGIWDGFLYPNLIKDAKALGLTKSIIDRIEQTVQIIEEDIENFGERTTLV